MSQNPPAPAPDVAASAGRGFLVITGAKLWFMLSGAVITLGLPKLLGAVGYGQFGDVNNILSIASMMLVTGVTQAVAKFTSERPEAPGGVVRQAVRLMLLLGLLIGGGFAIAAPLIADLRDSTELTMAFRLSGVILFAYAVYAVYIGALNGRKLFVRQALFDIAYSTMRAIFIVGAAALGLGVLGVFGGFALAALVIVAVAALRVGPGLADGPKDARLYAFAFKVMGAALLSNLIFKADILILKPVARDILAPLNPTDLGLAVDALIGQYNLAVGLARLPWQATIALTFVIFPLISEISHLKDVERTRGYVRQAVRYSLLLISAAAVVFTSIPELLVNAIWGPEFAPAGHSLKWLAPAYVAFALFNILNTLLSSSGHAGRALMVSFVTLGSVVGAYLLWLPGAEDATALLVRVGQATLAGFAVGLALSTGLLVRLYGSPFIASTTVRVLACAGVVVAASRFLPPVGRVGSLAVAVGIALAYVVLLVVTREFGPEDKARLQSVLKRKKAA